MKGKNAMMATLFALSLQAAGASDLDESFALNFYFTQPAARTRAKVQEYRARLEKDSGDHYANLDMGILYCVLATPQENPEKGAAAMAVKQILIFEKAEGCNVLSDTYLGLGYSLVSRDSRNPFTQLGSIKKAIAAYDKAVSASAGEALEWYARYMRACCFMSLPDSFKKGSVAEEDLDFLLGEYDKNPGIETYLCAGYYYLGVIAVKRGDKDLGDRYWRESVSINEKFGLNPPEAKKAAAR